HGTDGAVTGCDAKDLCILLRPGGEGLDLLNRASSGAYAASNSCSASLFYAEHLSAPTIHKIFTTLTGKIAEKMGVMKIGGLEVPSWHARAVPLHDSSPLWMETGETRSL